MLLMACAPAPEVKNGQCLNVPKTACDRVLECQILENNQEFRDYCEPCAAYYLTAAEKQLGISKYDLDTMIREVDCNRFRNDSAFLEAISCVTGVLETVEVE